MVQIEKMLRDLRKFLDYDNWSGKKKLRVGAGILVFFCVLPFIIRGCSPKPQKEVVVSRLVQTASVIQKDVPIYVESFGTLKALNDVDIQSQVTGKIKEVNFTQGEEVKKGDLLFTIDPIEYKADLDKAEAALEEDLADLKLKRDTLERNRGLVKKELISRQDFEDFQTEVVAAEAQVQLDNANVDLARINLGYCYISSPVDGLTGKRRVDPGNLVTANSGPVLVNVKTVDPFYLDFTLPERDLSRVRDAMAKQRLKVEIHIPGDDKGTYTGELDFVDNSVDDLTGTVSLRATIPNKERRLWAGQFVKVRLILGTRKNAILAPYEAVRLGQKGAYLFIVTDDNEADLKQVLTGDREDDYIIIEKGVEPGERAVTVGQLGLAPGVPVRIVTGDQDQGVGGSGD
ncbi:MAG: efflux RND transporter periplasmic adaptor subunit [Candidatus Omnitrophota bacterium]|nr:efflux RND transporter periplasmic adaptor subunit [Candidatus Omnitrophota bacterium]